MARQTSGVSRDGYDDGPRYDDEDRGNRGGGSNNNAVVLAATQGAQALAAMREMTAVARVMAPVSETAPDLTKAVAQVMREIGVIGEDKKNEFHKYWYASINKLREKIGPFLGKAGLTIGQSEVDIKAIGDGRMLCVTYDMWLEHSSGERSAPERVSAMAELVSKKGNFDDKAISKCRSLAFKDFLKSKFSIATGERDEPPMEDDDPESTPDDRRDDRRDDRGGDDRRGGGSDNGGSDRDRDDRGDGADQRQTNGRDDDARVGEGEGNAPRRGARRPVNNAASKLDNVARGGTKIIVPECDSPAKWVLALERVTKERVHNEGDMNDLLANEHRTLAALKKNFPDLYDDACTALDARASAIDIPTPNFP